MEKTSYPDLNKNRLLISSFLVGAGIAFVFWLITFGGIGDSLSHIAIPLLFVIFWGVVSLPLGQLAPGFLVWTGILTDSRTGQTYEKLIEKTKFSALTKLYLMDTWLRSLLNMEKRARAYRMWYYALRLIAIIGGILIPPTVSTVLQSPQPVVTVPENNPTGVSASDSRLSLEDCLCKVYANGLIAEATANASPEATPEPTIAAPTQVAPAPPTSPYLDLLGSDAKNRILLLSLLVAFAAAWDGFFQYGARYRLFRGNAEEIESTGRIFMHRYGDKTNMAEEDFRKFVNIIERLIKNKLKDYIGMTVQDAKSQPGGTADPDIQSDLDYLKNRMDELTPPHNVESGTGKSDSGQQSEEQ